MQRWEYHEVFVAGLRWGDSVGRYGEVPRGVEIGARFPVQGTMMSAANELGAEGWELVGVISTNDLNHYRLVFKRPKP